MAKIILSGYYGFDNLGDEGILMAVIAALKSVNQELEFTILSNNPEITDSRYQENSINRNNFRDIIREIKEADLFISGGGSLLQDITGWKSIPFYLGQVYLAQLLGKKTVFYAQGIGPVNSRFYQRCIRFVMNRSDLVSVRDTKSRELLIKWGVKPDKVELSVDPVFVLKNIIGDYTNHREKGDKPLIGVSVRPWGNNDYIENFAEGLSKFAREIKGDIIILPLHLGEDQGISENLKEILVKKFKKNSDYQGSVFLEKAATPLDLIKKYQEIDFFLGVRLHSLIFSAISTIPFFALEYDPKVKAFVEMLGINSSININKLDSEKLFRISMTVWDNYDTFRAILAEKNDFFAELSFKNAISVSKLIGECKDD